MRKDKRIHNLIEKLKLIPGFEQTAILDNWDADLCAIGIKKANRLIYINTFDTSGRYDYDLELLDEHKIDNVMVVKRGRAVDEQELIHELVTFLCIDGSFIHSEP